MDYSRIPWSNYWVFQGLEAFGHLAEYARLLEGQIDHMAERERRWRAATPPDEDDAQWRESYQLFEEAMRRNFRYSGVTLLVTTIETVLLEVCHELRTSRSLLLTVGDLNGRTHQKALKYLRKVAGIQLPASTFLSTLSDVVTVRNCIVHAGGNVTSMSKPSPKDVRAAVNHLDGVNLSDDGYVQIDKGVCARLVDEASKWLDDLAQAT